MTIRKTLGLNCLCYTDLSRNRHTSFYRIITLNDKHRLSFRISSISTDVVHSSDDPHARRISGSDEHHASDKIMTLYIVMCNLGNGIKVVSE